MTRAQPGSLFSSFLVAGALSALDVIDWVVHVCVCVGGHPFAVNDMCSDTSWGSASRLQLLHLKAVRVAVWAMSSLTPLENCIQIKILNHSGAEGFMVHLQYIWTWNSDNVLFFFSSGVNVGDFKCTLLKPKPGMFKWFLSTWNNLAQR